MSVAVRVKGSEVVELRDGTKVTIRPICPDDARRLQSLFGRLSQESIYYRFLELRKELSYEQARCLADLDHQTQMALVAACGQCRDEAVIGVARYEVIPGTWPTEAEVAIVVEDQHQGKRLGTLLLERLTTYAVKQGIHAFQASVLHDNARMMRLIRRSGLPTETTVEAGILMLRVGLNGESVRQARTRRVLERREGLLCQEGR